MMHHRERPSAYWERVARAATYFLQACMGVAIIVHFIAHAFTWPDSAISGMAGVFLLAGFPAAKAAFSQRFRSEYICLPFQIGGITLYAWWLWVIAAPTSSVLAIHTLIAVTLLLAVVTRLFALHPLVKPQKEHTWTGLK